MKGNADSLLTRGRARSKSGGVVDALYWRNNCIILHGFHCIWASTMSFTNIYHQLLWILQYRLGNLLYVIFTGFWLISHEIHHNWWQVRKGLRDVILWRRWQEKGLVNSWAVTVLIKAFLNQKLHRDIKSYKFMEEFMEKIFPIYQKLEGLVQPRRIPKILEP